MPSDDIAISVRNLTKTYRIFGHPGDRIKQALTLGRVKFHREFTALRDVSFDIKKGEAVGIIGRNGSGKSTLLQLICGILKPTAGSVQVNGRVSALLELGAGFNPEFTGRENVYFQGALMGFDKSAMDAKFDDIAAFADIGEFIDQPVRTYSSGMFVRLAFSAAAHLEPDVLIVDEALGVGDMAFQHKSRRRLMDLVELGVTMIVVSHDRATISAICDRCFLLDQGNWVVEGSPSDVFEIYHARIATTGRGKVAATKVDSGRIQVVSGTGEARLESFCLRDQNGNAVDVLEVGSDMVLEFVVNVVSPLPLLTLGFSIRDSYGQTLFGTNTYNYGQSLESVQTGRRCVFEFRCKANFGVGSYSISTALVGGVDRYSGNYECRDLVAFFEIENKSHRSFGGMAWLDPSLTIKLDAMAPE